MTLSKFSLLLYGIAGLLLLYTAWSMYHSYQYISMLITQNQLIFKGNEYDIISFYLSSSVQYALFAVVLCALGWLIQIRLTADVESDNVEDTATGTLKKNNAFSEEKITAEEFEEWFKQNSN